VNALISQIVATDDRAALAARAGRRPPLGRPFVLTVQAMFYVVSGLWSIVSIDSFMRVTGRKRDVWLVKTVGVLTVVLGVALGLGGCRGRPSREVSFLAVGSAAGFAVIDNIYVFKGTISRVYLIDACLQTAFIVAFLLGTDSKSGRSETD